jgi:hypothetical protein
MCHHLMPVVYGRLAFRPACVFVGKIKGTNCAVRVHSHSPYIPLRATTGAFASKQTRAFPSRSADEDKKSGRATVTLERPSWPSTC